LPAERVSCPPQYHASLRHLSRSVFVNFESVENAIPPVLEVEDRHVEHKHRVVHLPAARKYLSPSVGEILSLNFFPQVHSFCLC
jgi:hypothetical protein